jgi:TetR/AcrR family transcriptional regulator, regulator of biofilm formation and stress response
VANVRNLQRRRHILEAAVRVIGRRGPGAVTHRSVAGEAGVPVSATTYYFSSKGMLMNEALTLAAQSDLAELEALARSVERSPPTVAAFADSLASFLASQLRRRRTTVIAQFELILEAARQAPLRSTASASTEAYVALCERMLEKIDSPDPARDATLLVAMMDGLLLDRLSSTRTAVDRTALAAQLRRFIAGLLAAPVDQS